MSQSVVRLLVVIFPLAYFLSANAAEAQTFSTPWMHATQGLIGQLPWGVLDPQILFLPGSWGQLTAATGNWGGLRSQLAEAGISLFGAYESESAGNPVGGELHKCRYTHNIALGDHTGLRHVTRISRYLLSCFCVRAYRQ